jgi:hypothetical protein
VHSGASSPPARPTTPSRDARFHHVNKAVVELPLEGRNVDREQSDTEPDMAVRRSDEPRRYHEAPRHAETELALKVANQGNDEERAERYLTGRSLYRSADSGDVVLRQ